MKDNLIFAKINTVKALAPGGGLFYFLQSQRGLKREEGLIEGGDLLILQDKE